MAELKVLKVLKEEERNFIDDIVFNCCDKLESYCNNYNMELTEENKDEILAKANRLFNKPHILEYYQALMDDIRDKEIKKAVWTKEVATQKLMHLIEIAEQQINESGGNITTARLNAIMQPIKELNLMCGFNETNVNSNITGVQIIGEADLED